MGKTRATRLPVTLARWLIQPRWRDSSSVNVVKQRLDWLVRFLEEILQAQSEDLDLVVAMLEVVAPTSGLQAKCQYEAVLQLLLSVTEARRSCLQCAEAELKNLTTNGHAMTFIVNQLVRGNVSGNGTLLGTASAGECVVAWAVAHWQRYVTCEAVYDGILDLIQLRLEELRESSESSERLLAKEMFGKNGLARRPTVELRLVCREQD